MSILLPQAVVWDGYFHADALSPYRVFIWTVTPDSRVASHRSGGLVN